MLPFTRTQDTREGEKSSLNLLWELVWKPLTLHLLQRSGSDGTAMYVRAAAKPDLVYCPIFQGKATENPHRRLNYVATTEVTLVFVGVPVSGAIDLAPSIGTILKINGDFINVVHCPKTWGVIRGVSRYGRSHGAARVRLLKKARAQVAKRNERIQVREEEIKRLGEEVESLKVVEAEVHGLLSTLQAQVTSEERIKAAFEELKKYEDNKVEQRSSLGHWARPTPGCYEVSRIYRDKVGRDLADVEAYDLDANNKLVKALQELKDLKYPMVDQLEKLKDALMELIMASLHLENPQYPEVHAPEDPWAVKEEVLLEDAIAANISRAEKKKKCRVVCRTHGIGSAHHAKSDDIPVSVPTVVPQGLAILLADAGTQTQRSEDEASLRLLRSKSLPPMYNLDWP
ncbi:hypothetical protein Tco_1410838 [Tanacetum coccineum]